MWELRGEFLAEESTYHCLVAQPGCGTRMLGEVSWTTEALRAGMVPSR